MAKLKSEIQNITIANILNLKEDESISLTNEFLEALKPEKSQYAIIILTPNTKIIRIIPTKTDTVYKIAIDIGQLTSDFLKRIGNLFLRVGLKSLYSTGLCFVEDKCVFDGYVDSSEFDKISIDDLKKEILSVDGIRGVDISILKIE